MFFHGRGLGFSRKIPYNRGVVLTNRSIDSLPRGYISVKTISGHQYFYRQWREGSRIISSYVPESYLNVVKQKIEIRKQNEQLLKILKKDYKKAEKAVLKVGEVTPEEIEAAKAKVSSLSVEIAEKLLKDSSGTVK